MQRSQKYLEVVPFSDTVARSKLAQQTSKSCHTIKTGRGRGRGCTSINTGHRKRQARTQEIKDWPVKYGTQEMRSSYFGELQHYASVSTSQQKPLTFN